MDAIPVFNKNCHVRERAGPLRIPTKSIAAAGLCLLAASAAAEEDWRVGYTLYGTPGLIEMPSANVLPDAEFAMTIGGFENQQRASFSFQVSPRLTGTFRYSRFDEYTGPGTSDTFDRSFDLQYQFFQETDHLPALAFGLRDFMGTGLYTGEYVVATKTLSPRLRITGGLGWGRLASHGGFGNPLGVFSDYFQDRPPLDSGKGGTPSFDQFFRGDAAPFGGLEWRVSNDLTVIAEYSSDAYARETDLGVVEHQSPLNFGLRYQPRPGYQLSAHFLRGSDLGLSATLALNPQTRAAPSGLEGAPMPVAVRPADLRAAQSWDRTALPDAALIKATQEALALDGFDVNAIELADRSVRLRYTNQTYRAEAQGVGRVARVLTQIMPPSVENFVLEPQHSGIALSAITVRRSDIERLENRPGAAADMLDNTVFSAARPDRKLVTLPDPDPAFEWGIAPFGELQFFDGDKPIRGDFGVQAIARYEFRPDIVLSGEVRYRLGGNRSDGAISPSALHPVRRNAGLYGQDGGLGLERLALTDYGRLGSDVYTRASIGYLERMYAGASTEMLWKPVDSRLALGAEVNYVVQRDYDLGFGTLQFSTADGDGIDGSYDVLTGHLSAYYEFDNGFHGRIDVGRYLAGDWGATFALDREFANGWRIGAYATFTDVAFDDFGEGSFDKGIMLTIPTDWALGTATRHETNIQLNSLTRDGGARLDVDGRLYEIVRGGHQQALTESWGRFWR